MPLSTRLMDVYLARSGVFNSISFLTERENMTPFPPKAYFQIRDNGFDGDYIADVTVHEAGDISKAALSVDDDTASFWLVEDGRVMDASEDVALEWWKQFNDEVTFNCNNEPDCPAFIRKHCSEQIDELYGELETQRADHYQAQRDYYRGLGV